MLRWTPVFGSIAWLALALATAYWVRSIPPDHDLLIYQDAAARAHAGRSAYLPIDIGGTTYLYHPTAMLAIWFLSSFDGGFSWSWFGVNLVAWAVGVWLIADSVSRALGTEPHGRWWAFAAALTWGPLVEALYVGQINGLVTLAIALSLWSLLRQHDIDSGFYLAIAIVMKTSPALLAVHLAASRRWKAFVATLVGLAVLSALAAFVYGADALREFLLVVTMISHSLPPVFYNQSLISVLYRALRVVAPGLAFLARDLSGPLSVAAAAAILWPALRRPLTPAMIACSFVAIWIVSVILSPLVWYHHHMFLAGGVAVALSWRDRLVRTLGAGGAWLIHAQRALELAGGSRWLLACAGQLAVAAAVALCLRRLSQVPSPKLRVES